MRSLILKDQVSLFKSSALSSLYEQIMHISCPKRFVLYKFFFQCENLTLEKLLTVFSKHELDTCTKDGILSFKDEKYYCNYRFVPIDELLILSSPDKASGSTNYVHIGNDTITLYNWLKKECQKPINDALEIGCGAGLLSLWIAGYAKHVVAVDISQKALDYTGLNAKISGIENIATDLSDVYSNIQGKFDLIISNPPYEFLPEKNKDSIFSHGGHLGLEIVKKILHGLDEHLKENGAAYILANSYIKSNGLDPLFEEVRSFFHGKPFSIRLHQLFFYSFHQRNSFYIKNKISHSIQYLVKIKRASSFNLSIIPFKGFHRIAENLKRKFRA